ncbi:MAG: SUF system NifU family Fe-S cluster assembly protein [Armatimonadetes bacterium]|nr:SUF system NifU family Fe-S cluster assembly protein [Armatimonadota bacterium]
MFNDLYQAVILDHYRTPSNVGQIEGAVQVRNDHPSCGDKVLLSVLVEDGIVQDIAFVGEGCSISQASLSLMTEAVKGQPVSVIRDLYSAFRDMIHGQEPDEELLGDMVALHGVSRFVARVPCAMLGWETLAQVLPLDQPAPDPDPTCGPG